MPFVGGSGKGACEAQAVVEDELEFPGDPEWGWQENQRFGSSVVFVGNTSSIVAVGSDNEEGTADVHLYRRTSRGVWEYLASLELVDWEAEKVNFGASLASNDEGMVAVGAPLLDGTDDSSGKVYLYVPNEDFTRWNLAARFSASDGTYAPRFGASVAMSGSLVAIGSPDENGGGGMVYVYMNSGPASDLVPGNLWVENAKISPMPIPPGAEFGASVSLHGDDPATLVVGAPGDLGGGSAFVFKRQGANWGVQKLVPRDIQEGDRFGSVVVVSGCSIAVTSPGDATESNSGTGSVRIYNLNKDVGDFWVHSAMVEPGDSLTGDIFGRCIAMEGNTLLVGSPRSRGSGDTSGLLNQPGVIYHFERVAGTVSSIHALTLSGESSNPRHYDLCLSPTHRPFALWDSFFYLHLFRYIMANCIL